MYGGGLESGSRTLPKPADLSYANVGTYFAQRGFITVIPDYRLSPEVKYPDATADVRDAVEWITEHPESVSGGDINNIYLLGHSAGAVQVATMLLEPRTRLSQPKQIAGAILMSGGYAYEPEKGIGTMRSTVTEQYYGGYEEAKNRLPLALLQKTHDNNLTLPRLLLGVAEKEQLEFVAAADVFADALDARGVKYERIEGKGHNHISLTYALGTGEGEQWAEDAIRWIEGTH